MERRPTQALFYEISSDQPDSVRVAPKREAVMSSDMPWWTLGTQEPKLLGHTQETYYTYQGIAHTRQVPTFLGQLQNGIPYAFFTYEDGNQKHLRYPVTPLNTSHPSLPLPRVTAQLHSLSAFAFGSYGEGHMESQISMIKTWPQGESHAFVSIDPFERKYLYFMLNHTTESERIRFQARTKSNAADLSQRPIPLTTIHLHQFDSGQHLSLSFRNSGTLQTITDGQGHVLDIDQPQPFVQRLLHAQVHQDLQLNVSETLRKLMQNVQRPNPQHPFSQLAWA